MSARAVNRKRANATFSMARAPKQGVGGGADLDPVITMNAGGIIQSASDSIETVFGWTPTELFGRNVKVLIPEPRRSALDRYLDRYRNSDKGKALNRIRRFEGVRKDGKLIQIELSMSRAELPASAAPFFIGVIRDVSRQIDTESDTPAARSRLQQLVVDQNRALATASLRLHLADRLASLGTLAAGLGHDMNNVLLPVRARLNALEHAGITAAARNHVTAVRRSIAYLQHLSDGLHFLALDPDGPGVETGRELVTDLPHWWSQVGPLLKKAVPKRVKLVAVFPRNLPLAKIAPHWLTQAILNMIVNSGESIPAGRSGGRVRIGASGSEDGRTVKVEVSDNGRGMSPKTQRRAFDLFFTTKSRSMGTGLGLPLARKVAMRAGGNVVIQSEVGRGTTVALEIPAVLGRIAEHARSRKARTIVLSIRGRRTVALMSQVLAGTGLNVKTGAAIGSGANDIWVTDPTPRAHARAVRWRKGRPARTIVILGVPSKGWEERWAAVGALLIDPVDDVDAIRHTLGIAIGARS